MSRGLLFLVLILGLSSFTGCSMKRDRSTQQMKKTAAEIADAALEDDEDMVTETAEASEGADEILNEVTAEDPMSAESDISTHAYGDPSVKEEPLTLDQQAAAQQKMVEKEMVEEAQAETAEVAESSSDESLGYAVDQDGFVKENREDAPIAAATPKRKRWISVKKIRTTPFKKAGHLANAVYLARKGDTLRSISKKIYGNKSKRKVLAKINPHLVSRGVKIGDKVYYNSPNRSEDKTTLKVYYSDMDMPAQVYEAKSGENIRVISKKLLGHSQSWKEVWATNMQVESKSALNENISINYWTGDEKPVEAPTQALAENPPEDATDILGEEQKEAMAKGLAEAPVLKKEETTTAASATETAVADNVDNAPKDELAAATGNKPVDPNLDPQAVAAALAETKTAQQPAVPEQAVAQDQQPSNSEENIVAATTTPPAPPAPDVLAQPKKPASLGQGFSKRTLMVGASAGLLLLGSLVLFTVVRRRKGAAGAAINLEPPLDIADEETVITTIGRGA